MTRAAELKAALDQAREAEVVAQGNLFAAARTIVGFHNAKAAIPKEALDNLAAEYERHRAAVEKQLTASDTYCDAITKGAA